MNLDALYKSSSKHFKATDLSNPLTLTIEKVEATTVGGARGKEEKGMICFKGHEKDLILNKTNYGRIKSFFGPETNDWIGKDVVLTAVDTAAWGGTAKGVRIDLPEKK